MECNMLQHQSSRICYLGIIGVLAAWGVFPTASLAQIIPDGSVGSQVTPGATIGGQPANLIEGGAQRGANLFHSFSDFNVGNLQRVYFANPTGVQNILSRVTGTNPSNILGTLGVNGAANLFLLNPNGILFGSNARLDLRGSFVASTADSLKFDNGFAFSASNPQAPPLLTVNVPIGLQSGSNPGNLQVQRSTLRVNPGQTLALVGGNVTVDGGRLLAPGGRVELAGVASEGSLDLVANGSSLGLRVPASVPRTDVSIAGGADVNVRAGGGGSIAINARNVNIRGATRVRAGIDSGLGAIGSEAGDIEINATQVTNIDASLISSAVQPRAIGNAGDIIITTGSLAVAGGSQLTTSSAGQGNAGNVIINAHDTVVFDGVRTGFGRFASAALSSLLETGIGDGGDITITTGSLRVTGGAQLLADTAGKGNAGDVIINTRDTVVFDGTSRNGLSSLAASQVTSKGIGDGGDITITTGSLRVSGGAGLSSSIIADAKGNAGNVIINAHDTVVFDGVGSNGFFSGTFSGVKERGIGDGGDITITTGSLAVRNGAFLSADTNGQGKAGGITVNANSLEAVNGGQLFTTSFGSGKAGDITLNVTQNVTLAGRAPAETSFVDKIRTSFASGLFANTSTTSTNRGGDLTINTGQLTIRDGAQVSVSSAGSGSAGTLTVEADAIRLDRQGRISANTTGGGGNINLRSPLLTLRRNSSITTNATNATGTAKGGNISIAADFIVSPPNENNDIIANAFAGSGGKITLSAQNIFGFNLRTREDLQRLLNTTNPAELDPRRLPTNDITAFSQANPTIDTGAVTVQTLDLDPTRGLTALPTDFTDRSQLISATCAADKGSSFTITGRGGLPEDPRQPLMGGVIWRDDRGAGETGEIIPSKSAGAIVEAQGWMVDRSGTVVLVAGQPKSLPQSWYPTCALQQQ